MTTTATAPPQVGPLESGPVPLPPPLRLSERVRVVIAGLRDRGTFAQVRAGAHTDWTLAQRAACRSGELAASAWLQEQRHSAQRALDVARAELSQELPPEQPLPDYERGAHADWPARYRQAVRARAAREGQASRMAAARLREVECQSRLTHLDGLGTLLTARWAAAFERRALLYQRARSGWFGLGPRRDAVTPPYRDIDVPVDVHTSPAEPGPPEAPTDSSVRR
jgi:hypothetical protein